MQCSAAHQGSKVSLRMRNWCLSEQACASSKLHIAGQSKLAFAKYAWHLHPRRNRNPSNCTLVPRDCLAPWGRRPIHNATHPHHLRLGPPALQQPLCQQICCQIAGGNQQQPRLWQPQHLHNHHGRISQRPSTSMKDNCQKCKFCKPLTALRKGCRIRQYS